MSRGVRNVLSLSAGGPSTGNGILQQLIRSYLKKVSAVKSFREEDVQLGGAGITVVELY